MAGENVKNFFASPDASGDNQLVMGGTAIINGDTEVNGNTEVNGDTVVNGNRELNGETVVNGVFETIGGTNLKTISLHGRIENSTGEDGGINETDTIPIPFSGKIISIQAALTVFPTVGQINLVGRLNNIEITNGEISFNTGESFKTREVFPTALNVVTAGDSFSFTFIKSNVAAKAITNLVQIGGIATASVTAHGYTTGDIVRIEGANEGGYNGLQRITKQDGGKFVFVVFPTIGTPATTATALEAVTTPIIPVNFNVVIELD